jgi:hypothetical protein
MAGAATARVEASARAGRTFARGADLFAAKASPSTARQNASSGTIFGTKGPSPTISGSEGQEDARRMVRCTAPRAFGPKTMATTRITHLTVDRKMTVALPKILGNVGALMLDGATYTTADLVKLFERRIDAADAATAAYGKWLDAVKADHDELARTAIAVRALKDTLRAMFATQAETLAEVGLTPRKVGKRTVETKLQAAARARATREARGTMGKVQRKAVKALVTTTMVVTPVGATPPIAR